MLLSANLKKFIGLPYAGLLTSKVDTSEDIGDGVDNPVIKKVSMSFINFWENES